MDNKYSENILKKLRQREDLDKNDTSMDDKFNNLTPSEVFSEVLKWEGFGNCDYTIKSWIKDIYGFDIDEVKTNYFQHR